MERGECSVVGRCSTQWRREMAATDAPRTVDCLRGRLLAEREASRAAREEAELLMRKLTELERLLAEEIRNRDRAEKRLKCALVKLRSLKLVGGMVASASSEELLSGDLGSSPSISSEWGKSSPNPVGSLGLCDDENGRGSGDSVKDADLVTHSADSPCKSSQSVNMGSSKHSGECSESKSNSCDLELNGDKRVTQSLWEESGNTSSCKNTSDSIHLQEHGSDAYAIDTFPADIKVDFQKNEPENKSGQEF